MFYLRESHRQQQQQRAERVDHRGSADSAEPLTDTAYQPDNGAPQNDGDKPGQRGFFVSHGAVPAVMMLSVRILQGRGPFHIELMAYDVVSAKRLI
ncbi:hypothetical protein ERHA55_08720 [Erwinia rhapontici]|nr:hypothetical protein ERHA55_08720 [Erwinia rhapontici]